jgi:2-dehydro-3-deoxygluconokinase
MRIVSIGECMVELAPTGDGHFALGYAGDTFNTAWYLRRLLPEAAVDYLSAVGEDAVSARMLDFLASEGIGTTHIRRLRDRSVGLYLIQVDKGERSFAYWRSTSAARNLADEPKVLAAGLAGARLAYLSGITLAILAPEPRAALLAALRMARAAGTLVAFDPNIRPALWPDADVMRRALTEGAAHADIILPSFDDEAQHFGDATPEATARRYAAAGAGLVVVKDGPNPVVSLQAGVLETHRLPAPAATPVDSTAAGDSFNAAFLAVWLQDKPLAQAVSAGATLAAKVIAAPGALVRGAV